jgi:phosphate:Na+ symporter
VWSVLAGFLGGMGLFFMGLRLTSEGVKKIAGRRFRNLFLKCTKRPMAAALLGLFSGIVFQSTSGISLILASLIGAGVTTVKNALPVMIGANAGVACLVLVAVVDIKVLVMCLVGLSGLVISFERPARFQHVAYVAFGVGLLLMGLQTVRTGASPLAEAAWFRSFLGGQELPIPWYFLIGTAAGFVLQTAAGVTILTITLASAGILDTNDALAIIFGSLLGTSILYRLYAMHFTGTRKRLVMGQVFFNLVGLVIFMPLFIIESKSGIPLLEAAAKHLFPTIGHQLTAIRLFFDCTTAVLLLLCCPLYNRFLEKICPENHDSLESLAYVKELTDVSPETALLLIDKEQGRIMHHLPEYTANLRHVLESPKPILPHVRELHEGIATLSKVLDDCLLDMITRGQVLPNANVVALLQDNQSVLRSISDTLRQLVEELAASGESEPMNRLRGVFLEVLEALLLQASDVFSCMDEEDWDMLLHLLSDKGPVMDRLRGHYLNEQDAISPSEQWRLMRVTGLYERCTWLLRRLTEQQRRFLNEMGEDAAAMACATAAAPTAPIS